MQRWILDNVIVPLDLISWKLFIRLYNLIGVTDNRIRKRYLLFRIKLDPPPKIKRGEFAEQWLMRIDLKYAVRYVELLRLSLVYIDEDYIEEQAKDIDDKEKRELALVIATGTRNIRELQERLYTAVMDRKYVEEEFDFDNHNGVR